MNISRAVEISFSTALVKLFRELNVTLHSVSRFTMKVAFKGC